MTDRESLRAALLRAVGHSASSPQTERCVAWIKENLRREGRKDATVTKRTSE